MSTPESPSTNPKMLKHMATINRLNVKAFNAQTQQELTFIILNDSIHALRYDRAILWKMDKTKPKLLGVSGQVDINRDADLTKQWQNLIQGLIDPNKPQIIDADSFVGKTSDWNKYKASHKGTFLWLPIFHDDDLLLGMWIEIFSTIQNPETLDDTLKFITSYLTPAYGASWKKLTPKFGLHEKGFGKKQLAIIVSGLIIFCLIVRVPLRVVAPCEVIANSPILITAPLDGIVEEIIVEPGDFVKKGEILLEYDKRIPLRNLKVAQKEVEILEAESSRTQTLGLEDKRSRTELGIINLKLDKEKVNLNLAKWQASKLTLKAPDEGVVMLNNPDSWRGKPVQVGEKILSINDPKDTKVKIWIPEDDNVVLDPEKPIKVFLNVSPETSYAANLVYIANESTLSDEHLPSYAAEAKWVEQPDDIKLGLKGTAILYGDRVSLLYYIFRKPWAKIRSIIGV
jgi:HlyD family secretion protein/Biotin-lipoyl like